MRNAFWDWLETKKLPPLQQLQQGVLPASCPMLVSERAAAHCCSHQLLKEIIGKKDLTATGTALSTGFVGLSEGCWTNVVKEWLVLHPESIRVQLQLSLALGGQLQPETIIHYGQENYEVQTSVHKKVHKLQGISISDG